MDIPGLHHHLQRQPCAQIRDEEKRNTKDEGQKPIEIYTYRNRSISSEIPSYKDNRKLARNSPTPTHHWLSSDAHAIFGEVFMYKWVDNIRMDLQEVGCGYMDWIGLAQDRDRWRTLVSAVMNLGVP